MLRFDTFEFDAETHRLTSGGQSIHLTPKAFELLRLLIGSAPKVVSKEDIHARIWPGQAITDATLVGLIKEIRGALGDRGTEHRIIRTVHRVGYAFDAPLTSIAVGPPSNCLLMIDGHRSDLAEGDNIVGRDPSCDVWIDEATVSRRHARITVGAEHVSVADLGSKNGTCVRDRALGEAAELRDGDELRFGHVRALFFVSPSARSTETQITTSD